MSLTFETNHTVEFVIVKMYNIISTTRVTVVQCIHV